MNTIISGYTGLFRPPVENLDRYGSTMYCVTGGSRRTLVILALVPGFFHDAYNLIKRPQYQQIILITPSPDVLYISDLYNLYREVTINLRKNFQVITPYELECPTSDAFEAICYENQWSSPIDLVGEAGEHLNIVVSFVDHDDTISRKAADIVLEDGTKTIYFCQRMTEAKADYLSEKTRGSRFTEVHMPFVTSTYGGLTYLQTVHYTPNLAAKLFVHGFTTLEECDYCRKHGIKYGRLRYDDFI